MLMLKVLKLLSGAVCSENMDNELPQINSNENVNPMDPSCSNNLGEENRGTVSEVECYEDEDSDSDYDSIQKPAFLVDGEPNFDLGPPDDGWEYLRRVRWEAAQIPKVTIAKLDRSKLDKEQSAYMPKIPDMAKCPEHLLPSKQWRMHFLLNFQSLERYVIKLSQLDVSRVQAVNSLELTVNESGTSSVVMIEEPQHHSHESIRETTDQTTLTTEDKDTSSSCPLLSTILRMDSVARVSMLHKRIRSLEPIDAITRNDCMWLFALCATVDAPLDADSCAALRSLLRKCANLRAMKTELDDEVVMLNILAAISGRYFGQAEN
ncbi:gem-associated protein 2-like [Neltuma alba]|uniref:gem-associated protein 2-like n=1 Tax=Neltuma alba TaxID=207710 RepID=UPI0010A312E5|nr:gem-associated protein 2-like [Prosopis alba]